MDPYQMNTDPQPCLKVQSFEFLKINLGRTIIQLIRRFTRDSNKNIPI
jgi:hypothetical protein